MNFFDYVSEKKLIVLIISIVLNLILISVCGYLLYQNLNFECYESNTIIEDIAINSDESISDFYVEVKGEVKKPGVYKVNKDNIINDLVNLAGGFTKSAYTNNINLSKKLSSELVIYVYSKSEYKKLTEEEKEVIIEECICPTYDITDCTDTGNSEIIIDSSSNTDENLKNDDELKNSEENNNDETDNKLININIATKEELKTLTGIGDSKANAIIEYRNKNKFIEIEDIKNVSGIGEAAFEKIKDSITV